MARVTGGPDLSLQYIGDACHGKLKPQYESAGPPGYELGISRIGLNLYSKLGARFAHIQREGKAFDPELRPEELLCSLDLIYGDNDVEVEADHGVGVCRSRSGRQ